MCGIFALVHPPHRTVSLDQLRRACSLLRHRGPDQSGYALLHNGTIGFGHNRLAVQDLKAPPQPLVDTRTGTAIIFNGEVYDHVEIGRELKAKHQVVLTEGTDTAVILALYLQYGPTSEFFHMLNGEFSFVIWDPIRKQVLAVRDRFGIKPLYWFYDETRLAFSSEIKALASMSGFERRFSTEWLDTLEPSFSLPQHLTFMANVYNLLPGHYLTLDITKDSWNTPELVTYWSAIPFIAAPRLDISYDEAKNETRKLITEAVKRRLVADREVCVYLSGGVDSTVVCGVIHELGHPLTCFTIGFGDNPISEESLAAKTAEYYSLPHECITYTLEDTVRDVERTLYHTEIPLSNPHSISKFRMSEFAHERGFVVALTGEGSDEILLGYAPFKFDVLLNLRSKGPEYAAKAEQLGLGVLEKEGTTILTGIMPTETPLVRGIPSWQAWHFRRLALLLDDIKASTSYGHSLPSRNLDNYALGAPDGLSSIRMAQVDWVGKLHNYIIPCLGERVEMASSIEGRPPLLDPIFAEFALQLPQDYLIDPETLREKKILYDSFEDLLPPHIRQRTKQPFLAPEWYQSLTETVGGRDLCEKYLSRAAIEHVDVWSFSKVNDFLLRLKRGEKWLDSILGIVLSIQILHSLFIETDIVGDPDFPMVDRSPDNSYRAHL